MAQTTGAMNGVNCTIEAGAAWTDISGSANQVTATEQRRMSGEAYTYDGDVAIVKGGKREPVEVTFRIIYTETASEGFDVISTLFETDGGGACSIRWTPESGGDCYTITSGVITRFNYPATDASDANPIVVEFSVKAPQITTA